MNTFRNHPRTRRAFLGLGLGVAGGGLLAACSEAGGESDGAGGGFVSPDGPEVRDAEAARDPGRVRSVRLEAAPAELDLGGGVTVPSWAYAGALPGREVRLTAGETLALTLANRLPEATSVHWHGIALRNDMDGVPGLTQPAIAAGDEFAYRFAVPHPGTYWFHPHTGVQQDRGLYAPLIVEDPREPLEYDHEWVVVLDDWLDGVDGSTPDAVLAELAQGMDHGSGDHGDHGAPDDGGDAHADHGGHSTHGGRAQDDAGGDAPSRVAMGQRSDLLGGDAGDVAYPHYLANGRTPADPETFRAAPGDRVRIRLVNAGGDTAFRVALGGHEMTVTHTDGFPVEHRRTDTLLLGMGERYDVLVTAGDGVFPLTALAEGKDRTALAVLRTGSGSAPAPDTRPAELAGRLVTAGELTADAAVRLADTRPDRTLRLTLTGTMARYDWGFDGAPYDPEALHPVRSGERVRLTFVNDSEMWHPMHLHGHTFALAGGGPRKDTAIVLPGQTLDVDFDADNPGRWMVHCHNVYHSESGMMTTLGYQR